MTPQKIAELIELTVTPHGSKTRFGVYMDAESWGVVMKSLRASPGEADQRAAAPSAREVAEKCAKIVDQCNREGPYQAIGAASRIRAYAATLPSPQPESAAQKVPLPHDARLANAPYGPGKRIVGIVIDADKFRYMHEAIDWLRAMLSAAPTNEEQRKSLPPTFDDLEAALRQEYGGTPNTDALLDVVLPMLRAAQSATTAIAARRYSAGEITAAKFGELLGLEPGELQAFKVACGAYTESLLQPAVTARAVDHKEGKRPNKPMSLGEYERAALDGSAKRDGKDG